MEKFGGVRESSDSIWRHVACWISKATRTQAHSHARAPTSTPTHPHALTYMHAFAYAYKNISYLLLFYGNNGFVNPPHCYVIRTLPVLFNPITVRISRICHLIISPLTVDTIQIGIQTLIMYKWRLFRR